jgi:large subunit ribosomal protein L18
MRKNITDLKFKRRRQALTNYKKRLELVKSGMDRVIVRKTNKRILGQVARYSVDGDRILSQASSNELEKFGWPSRPNRPTAYLTGLLLAKKYHEGSKADHILDIGLSTPVKDSIPFVFAKGCMDGGMKVKANIKLEEKTYNASNTKHIAEMKSKEGEKYKKQYSAYLKANVDPENIHKLFNDAKEKIMKHEAKK